MNVLFVCTANQLRSPTAAAVFADQPGLETRSAGIHTLAEQPLRADLIGWADRILVMEDYHESIIKRRFKEQLGDTPVAVLDIPDVYEFMDPELVGLLEKRVPQLLK